GVIRGLSLLVVLLLWQLLAWRVNDPLLPSPLAVLDKLVHALREGELLHHLLKTLTRVAAAFAIAMIVGIAIGLWMGRSRSANLALDTV
ncbi:hypothetical protein ACKI2C_50005, partial [Streptomyces brasiliscabiei]